MSENKKTILAIATIMPLVLMPYVIMLGMKVKKANNSISNYSHISSYSTSISPHMARQLITGEKNPISESDVRTFRLLNAFMVLYVFALSIIYVVIIAQNNDISSYLKTFWIVAILFGGVIAMPFYWFKYIWKTSYKETVAKSGEGI